MPASREILHLVLDSIYSHLVASKHRACKHVCTICQPFWEKVDKLGRHSILATVVCDCVYDTYVRNSLVTTILLLMKRDRCTGNWRGVIVI